MTRVANISSFSLGSLSTCYLTDASCVELSSVLQVSQTLKELFVFTNALGDTRVQHLCEGL